MQIAASVVEDYAPARLLAAIDQADEQGLAVAPPPGVLTGFAGNKLTGLLQRIPGIVGGDYIEIGVFRGSSLLHVALANPRILCHGIDNYIAHDPGGHNKALVVSRAQQLGITNYRLIEQDFEDAMFGFEGEAGTCFIDGPHDYRSQLVCLAYATRFLKRGGVLLVDDANYPHVRQATADFLVMFPSFKLVFEAYTPRHPTNMSPAELAQARAGWWDGVHVIVHDPEDHFDGLTPPTPDNARFIRDHEVQIGRHGALAYEAIDLLQAIARPWQLPKAIARLAVAAWSKRGETAGRYRGANTESEGLPTRIAEIH